VNAHGKLPPWRSLNFAAPPPQISCQGYAPGFPERWPMADQEEWMDVRSLWRDGHTIRAICRLTGMSRNTVRGVPVGRAAGLREKARRHQAHPVRGLCPRAMGGDSALRRPHPRGDPRDGIRGFGADAETIPVEVSRRTAPGGAAHRARRRPGSRRRRIGHIAAGSRTRLAG